MDTSKSVTKHQPARSSITAMDKPAVRFIKRPQVESITGLSSTEIYRRIATDSFPKQVMLGPKCVVWVEAEVIEWCEARIAESREVAA